MRLQNLGWIACLALLSAGCALLGAGSLERRIEQAQKDDAYCRAQGHVYPSDAYTACRRTLANERQKDAWLELQLVEQNDAMQTPATARDPMRGYRPIRAEDFYCYKRTDNKITYVACEQK